MFVRLYVCLLAHTQEQLIVHETEVRLDLGAGHTILRHLRLGVNFSALHIPHQDRG